MSLRLIYGRAGAGKTQFCFNEIKDRLKREKQIYVITPEQFSFTSEKKLMNSLDREAAINAMVLTFNRMAYRVKGEVRGCNKNKPYKIRKGNAYI